MKLRVLAAALACAVLSHAPALAQTTLLPPGQQCFQATSGLNGMVGTLGTVTGGSGGTAGTYGGVALTGGSGTGATANITVSAGAVSGVTILNPGTQYVVGDVLSAAAGTIGGATGFSVPINSVTINSSLAGGTAAYYLPNTLNFKTTWKNSTQTTPNTNPVHLDQNGCAIVYGLGSYRQIVKDSLGNTVWDALTASTAALGTNPSSSGAGDFLPIGTILPISGFSPPTNYVLAYGQAISRTTYSDAFTTLTISATASCVSGSTTLSIATDVNQIRINSPVEGSCIAPGTAVAAILGGGSIQLSIAATSTVSAPVRIFPWGNGDSSTTFNVPDLRGRVLPGADAMGGTAASRLTSTYYGTIATPPASPSATPSGQSQTLVTANLPPYTPAGLVAQITPAGTVTKPTITVTQNGAGAAGNIITSSAGPAGLGGGGAGNITNITAALDATPLFSGTPVTPAFTGTAQGGTSTPFSIIQPSITLNYAIKIQNGTLPTVGVISLGGMTGDILCGANITCVGTSISVSALANGAYSPGYVSMYPNPLNSPGNGIANQVVLNGFGVPIAAGSTTTGGLAEMETVSASIGNPMSIVQWGIDTNYPGNPNPQYINTSATWTTHPRGIWSTEIVNATINCSILDSHQCIEFDSAEIGRFTLVGQVVYPGTGANIDFHPLTVTPNDNFINFSLNDVNMTTLVATPVANANVRFNLSGAGANFGILQNKFTFKEINGGNKGIRVTDSTGTNSGVVNRFNHNIIDATTIHGQAVCGVCVGDSTTNQQNLSGNVWTTMFSSSSSTDAFVTYERNSAITIGINSSNAYTNGLHFKSGSINNVAVLLDMDGATNKVVDDNGLTTTNGNIVIGLGVITIGGYPVVKAEIGSIRQALDALASNTGAMLVHTASNWDAIIVGNGQVPIGQTGAAPSPTTISGDATLAATGALTVTKTNGVAFATIATSASASDLSAGTLPSGRITGSYTGLTGTGTLAAGATGAGFTVALGTSTMSGVLPAVNGGAGTVNGILKANGSGTVSAATAGTDYLTAASTNTLTNKTFDTATNSLFISSLAVTRGQYPGTATNDNATAGNIGEFVQATLSSGSAVALSTGTTADITSISLTAGDWDVEGLAVFSPAATTNVTIYRGGTNTTSATLPADTNYASLGLAGSVPNSNSRLTTPRTRVSIAGTTTVFLSAQATFSVSTLSAYGYISARRVR